MKNSLIIILFLFSMCNNKQTPEKKFEGRFKGTLNGIATTAELTVAGKQLRGEISTSGGKATIDGTVNGLTAAGTMKDAETGLFYDYTGTISGDELHFTLTSQEENNQKVDLIMYREGHSSAASPKGKSSRSAKKRNPDLVGVWKNMEILGGGDMSFATERFIELNEDGTMRSWTGRSAGSGMDMESDEANADRGEWYTNGNKLIIIDPATKEEATTLYSVSESGLLLHNGGAEKKIYEKVR